MDTMEIRVRVRVLRTRSTGAGGGGREGGRAYAIQYSTRKVTVMQRGALSFKLSYRHTYLIILLHSLVRLRLLDYR